MNPEDPTPHLERYATYEEACREFRFTIPDRFNIATAICRRHTDAVTRVALNEVRPAACNTYTFGALDYLSDKFATALGDSGIVQDDVVAVMARQGAAIAVAHFGALKLGTIVQPLPISADPTQIRAFLEDSKASALVVDEDIRNSLVGIPASVTAVFVVSDNIHSHVVAGQDKSFWRETYEASADFRPVDCNSNSAAFVFSIAERGSIRSILQSHAALIGSLAAFEMVNNFDLGPDAVFWISTAWASVGTLLGLIYPAWFYGLPVIAHGPSTLNSADALRLIEACRIAVGHLPLSQLQALMSAYPEAREEFDLKLQRLIASETPSPELVEWVATAFAASINTSHSTPDACAFAATCERWFSPRVSSVGKPVPGRAVEIVDVRGNPLPPGERGRIAFGLPDPALGREYPATKALESDWFVSEELGFKDVSGYLVVQP